MPNFFAASIFNSLSPARFNAISNHFHLGFFVPEEEGKVPGDKIDLEWRAMLNQGKNTIKRQVNTDEPDAKPKFIECEVGAFQDFLQRLHNLVTGKCDAMRVAKDLLENGDVEFEFPPDFEGWSPYEKGVYVFLTNRDFWESLCDLAQSRNCDSSRLWIEYNNLPAKPPKANDDDLRELEKVMVAFFQTTRPKTTCHIHSYIRKQQYNYFATIRDNPKYQEMFVEEGGKETVRPAPYVPPLRIIFVYDERGQFSIYGEMDKKDFDPLARELVKVLVDYDGAFDRVPKTEYYLEALKDRNLDWKVEASDCIERPQVCALTISPVDDENTRLALSNRKRNIYDCMDEYLKRDRLSNDSIMVHAASIYIKPVNHPAKIKPFTFRITQTSSGLKSLEDKQRELGEKYVRKMGFIRFPDISLSDILRAVKSPEAVLSGNYADGLSPELMRHLEDIGLLEQTDDAMMVAEDGSTYDVKPVPMDDEGGVLLAQLGGEGTVHVTNGAELKRYRLVFKPILQCVHDTLGCTGDIEMVVDGLVWKTGRSGNSHRVVYVVRDWDCSREVQDALKAAFDGSLVFHIGPAPEVVQVGKRRSDVKEKDDREEMLEAQCYQLDQLMDYTQEDGLVFHADIVRRTLKDMENALGKISESKGPTDFRKDIYKRKIEKWLWGWFDARLKAAKVIAAGDEDNPDVNPAYVDYEILTQKQIIDALNEEFKEKGKRIPANAFTNTRDMWRKDVLGFGQLFLAIADTFVKRRPQKSEAISPQAVQRLNDFYTLHSDEIDELRQHRPSGA